MNALFEAAKEVCDFMASRRWKFCIIGGLAVQRWGEPRLTRDADLTLLTGFGEEESFIDPLLAHFSPRRADAREFALVNRVLLVTAKNGTPVDLSLAALPFEEEVITHTTPFEFAEGFVLPTCSADDLFIMKAFASRPKDWMDTEGIVSRQGAGLDQAYVLSRLQELSEAVYRPEIVVAARRILKGKPWQK